MKEALKLLNNQLKNKTYLVGNKLTIVDVFITLLQLELQQVILDPNFRISMQNLNNHFKNMIGQEFFKKRMGNIKPGKKQIMPYFGNEGTSAKDLNKA